MEIVYIVTVNSDEREFSDRKQAIDFANYCRATYGAAADVTVNRYEISSLYNYDNTHEHF